MSSNTPFWQTKSLLDMSHDEWESVCDGCAKCCLTQLEDEDTGALVFTDVSCALLDCSTCRCSDYHSRSRRVPECVSMNRSNIHEVAEFAPSTCSYRLLLAGDALPSWHHLVTGLTDSVHQSGNSVLGRVRRPDDIAVEDLESYVIDWVE